MPLEVSTIEKLKDNSLKSLHLCNVEQEVIIDLSKYLMSNTSLTILNISSNKINDTGVYYIAELISSYPFITDLNLSANQISVDGMNRLCNVIKSSKYLKLLDISGNNLGDRGFYPLTDMLRYNKSLIAINVIFNNLTSNGVKILSDSIVQNNTLLAINLTGNRIDNSGADILLEMLNINRTIVYLGISQNKIDSQKNKEIDDKIQNNNERLVIKVRSFLENIFERNISAFKKMSDYFLSSESWLYFNTILPFQTNLLNTLKLNSIDETLTKIHDRFKKMIDEEIVRGSINQLNVSTINEIISNYLKIEDIESPAKVIKVPSVQTFSNESDVNLNHLNAERDEDHIKNNFVTVNAIANIDLYNSNNAARIIQNKWKDYIQARRLKEESTALTMIK